VGDHKHSNGTPHPGCNSGTHGGTFSRRRCLATVFYSQMNENSQRNDVGKPREKMALEDAINSAFSMFGLRCETVRIPLEAHGGILLASSEISQYGGHLARGLNARGFRSATFESTPIRGVFIGTEETGHPPALREALVQELAVLRPVIDDVEFLQRL
jgi:hypothetical protein